ncbi:MAG TPA: translational GTPase TypA [Candidatus Saccharibacteria bacterium]|nr:translational GTPase TypA [Candidatus Saccharibacteria bacterium]
MKTSDIRNIAIIAHVDHGKTTLVDGLLKQSNTFRHNQSEMDQSLIMDKLEQERERGITIKAKITAVNRDHFKFNIIDTPGHADFGGEVERTLGMADGCILVVDAQEGPMPQTKFVLKKALSLGLKPILVINKIDKEGARVAQVEDEVSNLFLELAVDEDQLHYPTYYAIGRDGKAWESMPEDPNQPADLGPIFNAIETKIPHPSVSEGETQMLVTSLEWDNYKGKYAVGKINRGQIQKSQQLSLVKKDGSEVKFKVDNLFTYRGLIKEEAEAACAGDIVAITGAEVAEIGETICSQNQIEALPIIEVEPPTLKMYMGPNTSPFKNKEGDKTTSRQIGDRLNRELETNVSLRVEAESIGFLVSGRGELHLSVLIEDLRREGFELEVGRPQAVIREEDGQKLEPVEELTIEVAQEFVGAVQTELGARRAIQKSQEMSLHGTRMVFELPTRALIGLRGLLLTATKGTIIMSSLNSGWQPLGAKLNQTRNGALISFESGVSTPYALQSAEARGILFIGPGENVYEGQVVGINGRSEDLEINICKAKHLTNMRASGSDGTVQLTPATRLSLEQSLDFLEDDELLEVTPKSLRLRKRYLTQNERKKHKR